MKRSPTVKIEPNTRALSLIEDEHVTNAFRRLPDGPKYKADGVFAHMKDDMVYVVICRYYRAKVFITKEEYEALTEKIKEVKKGATFIKLQWMEGLI